MKKIIRFVLVIILLLVVGVFALLWSIDALAKGAIEVGTSYATGVPVKTTGVSLGLFSGEMGVSEFEMGNPANYKTPHLMKLGELDVAVAIGSLMSDTIVVPRIEMNDLDLYIEEQPDGTNNISVVLDNLQKLGGPAKPDEPPAEGGRKYRVDRITIRNITAHVHPRGIASVAGPITVEVPEIVLEDVTPENANGVAMAEITQRIMPAIIAAVVKKGAGVIPADLTNKLQTDVVQVVNQVGGEAAKLIEQVGGDVTGILTKAGGDVTKTIEGAGAKVGQDLNKGVEDVTKNVGGAIEGLFGGQKKK